jgi:sodium/potassium-transporting ATPase subunit alpha
MTDGNDTTTADKGNNSQRLKWQASDEETGTLPTQSVPRQQLTRTLSTASSATSMRANKRATVDPAITLPIHYRSL